MFIGLCGTFLHANSTVKRQVSLKVHSVYLFANYSCTRKTYFRFQFRFCRVKSVAVYNISFVSF